MKELIELTKASIEDLPSIYCDMDGVLVDFIKGADAAVGDSFVNADKATRWDKIHQVKGFWENLDWMPGAKRLCQLIIKYDSHILSAYTSRNPISRTGKMKWLVKNTNFKKSNINLVFRSYKQKFATTDEKPNILIDDYDKNIQEWETRGGIGILHTDVGKTINELKRLGFK